jgi:hypothetical protein
MTTLQDISTRELKGAIREVRSESERGDPLKSAGSFQKRAFVASRMVKGGVYDPVSATEAELMSELNTRPHIPGRAEGRVLRRLIAQTGWTAEQLRAHPRFGEELADAQYPNRRVLSPCLAKSYALRYGKNFGKHFKVVKP